jgi:uncharacterized protein (TIGR02231 family)
LEQKRKEYQGQIRQLGRELQAATEKRQLTGARFNQIKTASRPAALQARVSYAARQTGPVEIILEYLVNNVSWSGYYDLRGASESEEFALVAHARIRQSSGEDWSGVHLTLSSARPATGVSPGVLKPWRVSAGRFSASRNIDQEKARDGFTASEPDAAADGAESSETSAFQLRLPGKETIISNNAPHEIILKSSQLKGNLMHVALPGLSDQVFLRARLANTSGMPIFVGSVNIFLDGNYAGQSALPAQVAPGEQFELYLGADQRLRLKRSLLRGDVEGAGVFSKTVKVVNTWQVELSNYSRKKKQIALFDQYPVPADPVISTEFSGSSLPVQQDANGILRWNIEVEPGQTKKFDFSYALSMPVEVWRRFVEGPQTGEDAMPMDDGPGQNQPRLQKKQYNLERMLK